MDDGDLIEADLTDLDLNLEPYGSVIEDSHGIEERRIFQLGPVTARVRQRQRWRQSRIAMETNDTLMMGDGGVPDDNANMGIVERVSDKGKGYKRHSSHLVTQALAMDSEMKKMEEDGSFYDCNICLDIAKEPVLTLCGHLFCWPCLYQVFKVHSEAKQCPVCKGELSDSSVIPIYGNGDSESLKGGDFSITIPPRPKARRIESARQQHMMQGVSYIPVSQAIMQIIRASSVQSQRQEQELSSGLHESQAVQNTASTAGPNWMIQQVSRVLSDSAASLYSLSSAMNNAERLVEDLETASSRRRVRLNSTGITATNSSRRNTVLNNGTSSQTSGISGSILNSRSNGDSSLPLHRRFGLSRILERDTQDIRESIRRRLN